MRDFAKRAAAAREKRVPREHIAKTLRQNGVPAGLVSEITDLGLQAAYKAMDALMNTPDLSPDPIVKLYALNVARGVVAAELTYLEGVVRVVNHELGVKGINVAVEGAV